MSIRKCKNKDCKSVYQDQKYGKGMRVKNDTISDGDHRCTVCGEKEKGV